MYNRFIRRILILVILFYSAALAQLSELSIKDLFSNRSFYGKSYPGVKWSNDGEKYYYLKMDPNGRAIFEYDVKTGNENILVKESDLKTHDGDAGGFQISNYVFSPDQNYILFTGVLPARTTKTGGAFYLYDIKNKKFSLLADSEKEQVNAVFSPDGKRLGFVRGNNIWSIDIQSGKETQLTFDGNENILNGLFDWVYEEEFSIIVGLKWAPDSKSIAYWRLDQSEVPMVKIQKWDSLHLNYLEMHYPKPGDKNSRVKVGVVNIDNAKTTWMDIGTEEDIYIPRISYTNNSNTLAIERLNRLQNKMEILFADTKTGKSKVIYTEEDKAWIEVSDDYYFLKNKDQFIWTSEKDGYNHLYLMDYNGKVVNQITSGKFEVKSIVSVDEKNEDVYYYSNERSVPQQDLYVVKFNGKDKRRITEEAGYNSVDVSPNFKYYLQKYSNLSKLTVTSLNEVGGKKIRDLAVPDESFREKYNFVKPELLTFKTTDNVELYASIMKPTKLEEGKKYPVLIYNYSGPGSQSVVDRTGGPDQIWYQYLVQKGYIIFVLDNRGTGGRGAEFKKMVYKDLGNWEVNDMVEGAKYLASLPYIDKNRIGIWGWSYGGYMSALTICKAPEYFKTAIAVAPVIRWNYYDDIYTERYMSLPELNSKGYESSSPITYINQLKGNLLMIHGTADDNVHFQNTVKFVESAVENNVPIDVMFYPEKEHSIYGGLTRIHLYTKMTKYLLDNL
ncbi:MAG TPA: S9 family peptidase [Ignavibacteriaceae bacterium]|nr:S9 family peptidase [Ignavibacteriaceae bacterium]